MSRIVKNVRTWADGFGRWHAHVEFTHSLSESDPREQFNLGRRWPALRAAARKAIVAQLTEREQKTSESYAAAERRIRRALPRLVVTAQDLDASNVWHGVTLSEP